MGEEENSDILELLRQADDLLRRHGFDVNGQPISTKKEVRRDNYLQRRFEKQVWRSSSRGLSRKRKSS